MNEKWMGFLTGVTISLNLLALALLVFPLGLPTEVVRWTAAGVIGLDAVLEIAVFTLAKGGKK